MESKDVLLAALHRRLGGGVLLIEHDELRFSRSVELEFKVKAEGIEINVVCDDDCLRRFRKNEGFTGEHE